LKVQFERVTEASLLLGLYHAVVEFIELEAVERHDVEPWECLVDEKLLDPGPGLDGWVFRIVVPGSEGYRFERSVAGRRVMFVVEGEGYGASYEELLARAPRIPFEKDGGMIRGLAEETTRTGVEYILLYDSGWSLVVLEGGYLRVTIPFVRVVGSVHTHPEGSCGLSRKDVESGLDLLAEGGLFEASATPSCYFYMGRIGGVSEGDYVRVKMLKGDVLEPLRLDTIVFDRGYY
jgi:hypothetical protein